MNAVNRCVLVYNPLSGHGHLDSWNALFVSTLLAAGYGVIAVTENSAALKERLESSGDLRSPDLQILDLAQLRPGITERVLARAGKLLGRAQRQKPAVADTGDADPEANYLEPIDFARHIRRAMKMARKAPSMILNMYMDLYRTDAQRWMAFDRDQPIPWIGIRFIPRPQSDEGYYQTLSLAGMCFLDQGVVESCRAKFPGKRFFYLPDVTHADLPAQPGALVRTVQQQAAGRKIVFMGGTIARTKNLAMWLRMIRLADPAEWFFVQIGEIHRDALSRQDLEALDRAMREPPGNLFMHDGYLQDERIFNEIIAASDVVFAVYRDFPISSNMLGKAATFEKPILVADNHLMGERVVRYGIGSAVRQDDPAAMLRALEAITREAPAPSGFRAYREDFGRAALARHLGEMVECVSSEFSHKGAT